MLFKVSLIRALLPALAAAHPSVNVRDDTTISDMSNEMAISPNSSTFSEVNEYLSSSRHVDGEMSTMSGCDQSPCPDFNAGIDLFTWGFGWWFIRANDCGKCNSWATDSGGCADINTCGRSQSVCIDRGRSRMHRIWNDVGVKECYRVEQTLDGPKYCGDLPGGFPARASIWTPMEKIECNW